jgi:hypothetical protein
MTACDSETGGRPPLEAGSKYPAHEPAQVPVVQVEGSHWKTFSWISVNELYFCKSAEEPEESGGVWVLLLGAAAEDEVMLEVVVEVEAVEEVDCVCSTCVVA